MNLIAIIVAVATVATVIFLVAMAGLFIEASRIPPRRAERRKPRAASARDADEVAAAVLWRLRMADAIVNQIRSQPELSRLILAAGVRGKDSAQSNVKEADSSKIRNDVPGPRNVRAG